MGTYKNSYTESEDKMLWALHEIRHELHEEKRIKTIEEINREAFEIYSEWRKERDNKTGNENRVGNNLHQREKFAN